MAGLIQNESRSRHGARRRRLPILSVVYLLIGIALFLPANALAAGTTHPIGMSLGPSSRIGPGETELTYCDDGGVDQTLDVYESDPVPRKAVPAVLYIHGGGWTGGNDVLDQGTVVDRVAQGILAKGWVFVSIDYRLAPRFEWPAQIVDAKCAVRFLRTYARLLHVDPARIGAIGDSAGGQLVSLLGLTADSGRSAGFDAGPYQDESSAVQSVVDLFGPSDLTSRSWSGSRLVEELAPRVFDAWLGPAPAGSLAARELTSASPVTYVAAGAPPFLIMQGTDDTVVPPEQSVELASRLRAAGDHAVLVMVNGAQHGFMPASAASVVPPISKLASEATAFLVWTLN